MKRFKIKRTKGIRYTCSKQGLYTVLYAKLNTFPYFFQTIIYFVHTQSCESNRTPRTEIFFLKKKKHWRNVS